MSQRKLILITLLLSSISLTADGASLRFYGTGSGDVDRIKIPIDAPARPADVGGDFTLEWWMKALPGENATAPCAAGAIGIDQWMTGNTIFDRDVSGGADFGEYGISIQGGHVAFGVAAGAVGDTLCGSAVVDDGAWHHVAVTRRAADGRIAIFVDGTPDGTLTTPATGDISYRDGRATASPGTDPYLVVGARKDDTGPAFHGWIDEIRLSTGVGYDVRFARPRVAFQRDGNTVLLNHLDDVTVGLTIHDESNAFAGPSNGLRKVGGTPAGPSWSTDAAPLTIATHLTMHPTLFKLDRPRIIAHAGDSSGRIFHANDVGRIYSAYEAEHPLEAAEPKRFLDLSQKVSDGVQGGGLYYGVLGHPGFLGLAFHPDYASNGFFYVSYTRAPDLAIVIARYHVSADPDVADPASELVLKVIPHPNPELYGHNGGGLAFGPDGYLYAGIGDGSAPGDPAGNSQNPNTLLGKILRLDVNAPPPYIPPDNPFAGGGGAPEIWALGVRNPWRISFDALTGDLYVGDADGAPPWDGWDEVDFQVRGSAGGQNFGWPVLDGGSCYNDNPPGACNLFLNGGSILPIIQFQTGAVELQAIVGGSVFRGLPRSNVTGSYFYVDFGGNLLWKATPDGNGSWTSQIAFDSLGIYARSFGEDEKGHLFLPREAWGEIKRVTPYTYMDAPLGNAVRLHKWSAIEAITAAGITAGCAPDQFCPDAPFTRAQMAIFLLRARHGQSYLPPPATGTVFSDVPVGSFAADWIEQVYAEGMTGGCGDNPLRFCPTDNVRRDAMAVLLLRAREGASYAPPPCTGIFTDVPCNLYFAPWMEELHRRVPEVTRCTVPPCWYNPPWGSTRGEMAIYVTRVFNLPLP